MAKGNTVTINIVGDADKAVRAFKDVDEAGEQTQTKFKKVSSGLSDNAKMAFAGMGAGAVAVGVDMFKLGANLEQMDSKSKTVFGDQIDVVKKWAKENANAMGLTSREATGLATNMADLLIPMGMTRAQAAKMSTEVIGLSGALSAWSGGTRTASEVSDILTSAMLGETDALKGLGISISAAELDARMLAAGTSKLTGTAYEQARAQETMKAIMDKSTDAQNAFKDETVSANEKLASQKARLQEVREELATKFLPAVEWAMVKLGSYADATFNASEKTKGLQGAMFDFGGTLADWNLALASGSGKSIGPGGIGGGSWVGSSKDAVGNFLRGIFGMDPLPKRAAGGPVTAGDPFIVGEKRPELFVPDSNGTILPSVPSARAGGTTVVNNVSVSVPNYMGGDLPRDVTDRIVQALGKHFAGGGALVNARGGTLRPA